MRYRSGKLATLGSGPVLACPGCGAECIDVVTLFGNEEDCLQCPSCLQWEPVQAWAVRGYSLRYVGMN